MSGKNLKKKMIVTANQERLNEAQLLQDSQDKINAQTENPTIVPDLDPPATAVQTTLTAVRNNINKRSSLQQQLKENTNVINKDLSKIKDIFVDKWAKQIQNVIGDDVGKAKLLKFGVKGIYDGHAAPEINVTNSHALIHNIDLNSHLVHQLFIINSMTKKIGLTQDAKQIDVYMSIGAEEPADVKKMTYLGVAKRGKFTNHFTADQVGQPVWYYVVYVPRKAGVIPECAAKVKAMIV